jgi:hypothetical protein
MPPVGYYVPPDDLKGFPDAVWAEGKTRFNAGKIRKRWIDQNGNIYEWDYMHGRVERYSRRGIHEGEFDAETGVPLKGPVKGRKVEL